MKNIDEHPQKKTDEIARAYTPTLKLRSAGNKKAWITKRIEEQNCGCDLSNIEDRYKYLFDQSHHLEVQYRFDERRHVLMGVQTQRTLDISN